MNTRQKGNRSRLKCIKELENEGWMVGISERTGQFIFPKDLWGLFDLVCVKNGYYKFIQIATNKPHSHNFYQDFVNKNGNPYISVEQWVWMDNKGFKKWTYEKQ